MLQPSVYAEALEQQVSLLRWLDTPGGLAWFRASYVGNASEEHAHLFYNAIRLALRDAAPYYWSAPICALIESAAATMPSWQLTPDALVTPAGFMWFARPLPLSMGDYRDSPNCGLTGALWIALPDSRNVFAATVMQSLGRMAGTPALQASWPYATPLPAVIEQLLGTPPRAARDPLILQRSAEQMRYLAACWAFMEQQILVTTRQAVPRACRKRLARDGWQHEPVVRVVELRRHAARDGDPQTVADVEWSCQWLVRGHWRQQWCPKVNAHQPRWIAPYVKGPEDKPLKPPSQPLFAVVR